MKVTNEFKDSVYKKDRSSYKSAIDALIGTAIVFFIASILSIIDTGLALGFILLCILYTVMLIRFTQQKNN